MFYVNRSSPDHCFLKAKLAACIAFAAMVVGSLAVSPQVYSAEKPTAGKPKAWDQLVEKARREVKVVLYGPGGPGYAFLNASSTGGCKDYPCVMSRLNNSRKERPLPPVAEL